MGSSVTAISLRTLRWDVPLLEIRPFRGFATTLILGLALPTHHLVRDDAPYTGSSASPVLMSVRPTTLGRGGYGLTVDGIF